MGIRAIIGFDHLPQNDATWINYADHGITRGKDQSALNTISNGWLISNSSIAGQEAVTIPMAKFLASPVAKIWFGVRVRLRNLVNGTPALIYFGSKIIFAVTDIPEATNGTEVYLELSYTLATGVLERWVNGIALTNVTWSSGQASAGILLQGKGGTANQTDWRDLVVCDDQGAASGLPIGPLGSKTIIPVTLDSAVSTDWTTVPIGGVVLDAVYSPGSVPSDSYALSAKTIGALTLGLQASVPESFTVAAIELTAGTCYVYGAGTGTACAVTLKQGSASLPGSAATAAWSVFNYSNSLGVFHKNPAGGHWDNASINATDLILKPDK